MSNLKEFGVFVKPAEGDGPTFWANIWAINMVEARKLAKDRFPSNWTVGSTVKTLY